MAIASGLANITNLYLSYFIMSFFFAIFVNWAIKIVGGKTNYFKTLFILASNSVLNIILENSGLVDSKIALSILSLLLFFFLFHFFFHLGFFRTLIVVILSYVLLFLITPLLVALFLGGLISLIFI